MAIKVPNAMKAPLLWAVDTLYGTVPRRPPSTETIERARLVAHRGFGSSRHAENTLGAFDEAIAAGVWAVEFDVRWTSDGEPVVHHDVTAERVFNDPIAIGELSSAEIAKRLPLVPTLDATLANCARRAHLMIELKGELTSYTPERWRRLEKSLSSLEPIRDYHLIGLDPRALLACPFVPRAALFPVAEVNLSELSEIALREGMAGVSSQYVMMKNETIARHHDAGQAIGTGFPNSKSVLYRELNRGVDWLFSNRAAKMQAIMGKAKKS